MKKENPILILLLAASLLQACSSGTGEGPRQGNDDRVEATLPASVEGEEAAQNRIRDLARPESSLSEIAVAGSRIRREGGIRRLPVVDHVAPARPNRENYADYSDNTLQRVLEAPVSTFSIDVDTGSYSNVRRMLTAGSLPPADAVRAEELINYFSYDYRTPDNGEAPFSIYTEIAPSPWHAGKHLLHIGLQGYQPVREEDLARNLVFLVDVSGSMQAPNKLELLKTSLKLLSGQMSERDRISIVVYAGASGVVLEPAAGNEKLRINAALDRLRAGGGTNGGAGIELAYGLARQAFIEEGVNRVILATDGDFNVGLTDFDVLLDLIRENRESGVFLTTLGFGDGNYNDHLMEQLADAGNGNHAYIDTMNEARKVLVDELGATLEVIARDLKIQIEFNPAVVAEYRQIGYENRRLRREDFNNDRVDAGEIGAGHSVTALYEITLAGSGGESVDALRYGTEPPAGGNPDEVAFLRLRYKLPAGGESRLIEQPVRSEQILASIGESSETYRFSAAVASLAQLLRKSTAVGDFDYADLLQLAENARGGDSFGYRAEFINLARTARVLDENGLSPN